MSSKIVDKRYESVMRRLGLDIVKPRKKRKLLIIQIDALSHEILQRMFDKGSCRFLKSLIDKHDYHFQKYNCGIPSGTPTVQAGIMYGDNSVIPGFRFLDKKSRKSISFGNPNNAKHMENTYFSKKKGILEKGSSYSNQFSGGAHRSILTMSTMTKNKKFRRIKESNIWLFLFLHPASLLRVLYFTVAEMIIEFLELITHPFLRLFGKKKAIFGFRIPIRRFLMNVILTELITIGAIMDIKRHVPKIYLNFLNFDDIAHLRGPNSLASYFTLRALDRRVKRIVKNVKDDEYDIFIMSDHGQVDAVPFRAVNGMTLAEFIGKCARVPSFGLTSAHEGRLSIIGVVLKKSVMFLKFVSTPLRWMGTVSVKGMLKVIKPKKYRFVWDEKEAIFVLDSCALANVYFNRWKERADLKKIEKKHPKLITKLLRNKSIGLVMAKKGDDIVIMHRKGKVIISKDRVKKSGKDFLKRFGEEDVLIRQFRDLDRKKFLGDLVLFGNYANGLAVSFTAHVGAHGGIGGNMCYPFMISKERFNLKKVANARQLHRVFKSY